MRVLTMTMVGLLALAGCSRSEPAAEPTDDVRVVASTNVWGTIVTAIGGDAVTVTSIISDPAGDPHSYQLTPKDAAELATAELVVFNGGGYDEFIEQAIADAGANRPRVIEVFESAGPNDHEATTTALDEHGHAHGENEHVWYRLATVAEVAAEIAARLAEIRPESKATFTANAESFRGQLDDLTGKLRQLAQEHPGAKVAATEPLGQYLFEDAGLEDVTPAEFVEAIEEETDPPAAAVAEIQTLVSQRQIAVLVHNPQTETPVVADVVAKARAANVPVVEFTETLPLDQQDYVTWMTSQIEALSSALNQT